MKNISIFGLEFFFRILIPLRKMRESICSFIRFFLIIINSKMVPKELLGLPDLTRAQVLYILKLTEVIMICKYQNFVLAAF